MPADVENPLKTHEDVVKIAKAEKEAGVVDQQAAGVEDQAEPAPDPKTK